VAYHTIILPISAVWSFLLPLVIKSEFIWPCPAWFVAVLRPGKEPRPWISQSHSPRNLQVVLVGNNPIAVWGYLHSHLALTQDCLWFLSSHHSGESCPLKASSNASFNHCTGHYSNQVLGHAVWNDCRTSHYLLGFWLRFAKLGLHHQDEDAQDFPSPAILQPL